MMTPQQRVVEAQKRCFESVSCGLHAVDDMARGVLCLGCAALAVEAAVKEAVQAHADKCAALQDSLQIAKLRAEAVEKAARKAAAWDAAEDALGDALDALEAREARAAAATAGMVCHPVAADSPLSKLTVSHPPGPIEYVEPTTAKNSGIMNPTYGLVPTKPGWWWRWHVDRWFPSMVAKDDNKITKLGHQTIHGLHADIFDDGYWGGPVEPPQWTPKEGKQ